MAAIAYTPVSPFPTFPEISLQVFSHLEIEDLGQAQFVCKAWRDVIQDSRNHSLWHQPLQKIFLQSVSLNELQKRSARSLFNAHIISSEGQLKKCVADFFCSGRLGTKKKVVFYLLGKDFPPVVVSQAILQGPSDLNHYQDNLCTIEGKNAAEDYWSKRGLFCPGTNDVEVERQHYWILQKAFSEKTFQGFREKYASEKKMLEQASYTDSSSEEVYVELPSLSTEPESVYPICPAGDTNPLHLKTDHYREAMMQGDSFLQPDYRCGTLELDLGGGYNFAIGYAGSAFFVDYCLDSQTEVFIDLDVGIGNTLGFFSSINGGKEPYSLHYLKQDNGMWRWVGRIPSSFPFRYVRLGPQGEMTHEFCESRVLDEERFEIIEGIRISEIKSPIVFPTIFHWRIFDRIERFGLMPTSSG